jgi:hypothetical protein
VCVSVCVCLCFLGSTKPPIDWVQGLFPGVKRPKVKRRLELNHQSGPSWNVLEQILPLHFMFKIYLHVYIMSQTSIPNRYISCICRSFIKLSEEGQNVWTKHVATVNDTLNTNTVQPVGSETCAYRTAARKVNNSKQIVTDRLKDFNL